MRMRSRLFVPLPALLFCGWLPALKNEPWSLADNIRHQTASSEVLPASAPLDKPEATTLAYGVIPATQFSHLC